MSILNDSANVMVDFTDFYHIRYNMRGTLIIGAIYAHIKGLRYPISQDYDLRAIYEIAKKFTKGVAPELRIGPEFCDSHLLGMWFYKDTELKGCIFVQAKKHHAAKDIRS